MYGNVYWLSLREEVLYFDYQELTNIRFFLIFINKTESHPESGAVVRWCSGAVYGEEPKAASEAKQER